MSVDARSAPTKRVALVAGDRAPVGWFERASREVPAHVVSTRDGRAAITGQEPAIATTCIGGDRRWPR